MQDIFIYRLATLFSTSIIIWAVFAYMELWVNQNLKNTTRIIAKLLNAENSNKIINPPGYSIIEGRYKNRKIICRLSSFSPTKLLRYNLSLHIHIEPLAGDSISYEHTSLTAIKSYFLSSMITQDEFLQIFEDLTRAAEMIEATKNIS